MNPRFVSVRSFGRACRFAGGTLVFVSAPLVFAGLVKKNSSDFSGIYQSGNLPAALTTVTKESVNTGSKDLVLWKLEHGATLRAAAFAPTGTVPAVADPLAVPVFPAAEKAGAAKTAAPNLPAAADQTAAYLKHSLVALDAAEEKVNAFEEEAKVKVGSEVGASLTNLSALPYRGHAYDKVMMNTYKALAYLQLGEPDKARVELNRALQRQRDAVAENEKRIAEAQTTAQKAKAGEVKDESGKSAAYDADKATKDPKTGPALDAVLAAATANLASYGDYVNPFAVFLDGLFFTVRGEGGSDLERGRKSLERVAGMVPGNPYVKADLALASAAAEGKAPEGVTYIFFETGTAPARDEEKIKIPTFLVSSKVDYVSAAFPKLVFNADFTGSLVVKAGDQSLATATLCSMDSVIGHDFKNEWPVVVTKTMIGTATKAIVQATAQKSADKGGMFASLGAKVALTALNSATTHADTRVWSSLPKEFQYARVATPADRQLTLTAGQETRTVALAPGAVNVVYVKSIAPAAPLLVTQFALK